MNNLSIAEELDRGITQALAGQSAESAEVTRTSSLNELVQIARELHCLPRPEFKGQLKVELEWAAAGRTITAAQPRGARSRNIADILPTLSGKSVELYPLRRTNLAASVAAHACFVLLVTLGLFTVNRAPRILGTAGEYIPVHLSEYPPIKGTGNGSKGGGGQHEKTNASKGVLPSPARMQISTPVVEIRNLEPKLAVQASIVAPPDLNLPHTGPTGDPLTNLLIPSGGPGVRGGIGSGDRGGVGADYGPGFGSGSVRPGNGVSWPRPIYHPEPEFSEEARREHYQGVVSLLIVVGVDGRAHDIQLLRALGMGLDEKAEEAVRTWRFEPGKKDGRPVPVLMEVDVDFRIH